MKKIIIDESILRRTYIDERKTAREIADELGVWEGTVRKNLGRCGIPIRQTGPRIGKQLSDFHRAQISRSKTGAKNPSWKGGRVLNKGYVYLHRPSHPMADGQGYIAEHRLIMEKRLGRFLLPSEVVHHINGIPDDNRDENLMLFSSAGKHRQYHKNNLAGIWPGPLIQEYPK